MINLKIPDAAYAAGWDVFLRGQSEGIVTDAVIDAAMPLAFAAELRELRGAIKAKRDQLPQCEDDVASGMFMVILMIDNEIQELDPEGLTVR